MALKLTLDEGFVYTTVYVPPESASWKKCSHLFLEYLIGDTTWGKYVNKQQALNRRKSYARLCQLAPPSFCAASHCCCCCYLPNIAWQEGAEKWGKAVPRSAAAKPLSDAIGKWVKSIERRLKLKLNMEFDTISMAR